MLLKEFFIEIFDYFVVEENGEDEDIGFEGVEGHGACVGVEAGQVYQVVEDFQGVSVEGFLEASELADNILEAACTKEYKSE